MPFKPQYGDTNGVAELDLGQEDSARETAGTAAYNPNVIAGTPTIRTVENTLTQQNVKVADHLGCGGRRVTWRGTLKVDNDDTLAAIESALHGAMTGHTITAGVPDTFDGDLIKVTRITNKAGRTLSEKARLATYTFGRQRNISTGGATLTIAVSLEIVFEVMG